MSVEHPRHTVILGSYNRPRLIRQAIRSVLDQSVQDFQLIIADDGSNEDTLGSIRELIGSDPRCELRTLPHGDDGRERPDCANRAVQRINDAITVARGEIVHYLADDDFYDVKRFEIFDQLFANPEIVVGYGRMVYVSAEGQPYGRTRYFETVDDPCNVLDHNQVAHRRSVFDEIPRWADAIDWSSEGHFFRAMSRHWRLKGIDAVVAYKREHPYCMQVTVERSTGRRETPDAPRSGIAATRKLKFGAAIPVLNEWRFLPAVTGQLLRVVDRCVVLRGTRSFSGAPVELSEVPELDPRIELVEGNWRSEEETRNAGMDLLSDCDYVFSIDADEIMLDRDLDAVVTACRDGEPPAVGVRLVTYWKTPEWRIEPPETGVMTLVVKKGQRFKGLRAVNAPLKVLDVRCRHLSYVRTDEELREKLRLFSHAQQIRPDWYDTVWKRWDSHHDLMSLHPTHPGAYRSAVHDPDVELDSVLRRWGSAGDGAGATTDPRSSAVARRPTHWQDIPNIIGPATVADFDGAGQKPTREALERFIVEHTEAASLVLDAGCSAGVEAHRLFERGYKGMYVGIDSNAKAVVHAIENLKGRAAAFACSDLESIPWPDRAFDIVLTKDVIEHQAHYEAVLGELARVAKRWLVLSMFIRMHDQPDAFSEGPPGLFHNRYERARLSAFLARQGFGEPVAVFRSDSSEDEVLAFELTRPVYSYDKGCNYARDNA